MRRIKKTKPGFTLIEILLSLLVVTIGIVAMIGLLSSSLGSSAKAHDDLDAVGFADMVFNYCHSLTNWNEIPVTGTLSVPDYNEGTADLALGTIGRFTCRTPGKNGTLQERYTVTYRLDVLADGQTKILDLQVWSGFGTNGLPRIFYTEIYNWSKN